MIQAGRLRDLIAIEQEVRTANGQGGYSTVWSTLANTYAEVIGLSGAEALKAGIERNVQQWRVTVRRGVEVTGRNRIRWDALPNTSKIMNIKSVMPHPNAPREALLIMCESGGGS